MFLHHDGERHVPKVSANKEYQIQEKCLQEFPILLAFNYYLYVYLWFLYIWTSIYVQKEGILKHSGKKIMQLVWIAVTSLMLNMELNMILITSANGLYMHLTFLNFTADKFDSL